MRVVVLLGLVTFASGSMLLGPDGVIGYHEKFGIPLATRIKETEHDLFAKEPRNNRIVGGSIAPENAHPYMGGLIIKFANITSDSVCGSSLISPTRLVTAAHCWFDGYMQANQFIVVLGSRYLYEGGTRIATSTVFMNPQWDHELLRNDVAVIYLPISAPLSDSIQPVALPTSDLLLEQFVGEWATAAGYGLISNLLSGSPINKWLAFLRQVDIQVISVLECQNTFRPGDIPTETNICTSGAGGVGGCSGDSGGPLVLTRDGQKILIGIFSFADICCRCGRPTGFVRVTSFIDFINQHVEK